MDVHCQYLFHTIISYIIIYSATPSNSLELAYRLYYPTLRTATAIYPPPPTPPPLIHTECKAACMHKQHKTHCVLCCLYISYRVTDPAIGVGGKLPPHTSPTPFCRKFGTPLDEKFKL